MIQNARIQCKRDIFVYDKIKSAIAIYILITIKLPSVFYNIHILPEQDGLDTLLVVDVDVLPGSRHLPLDPAWDMLSQQINVLELLFGEVDVLFTANNDVIELQDGGCHQGVLRSHNQLYPRGQILAQIGILGQIGDINSLGKTELV